MAEFNFDQMKADFLEGVSSAADSVSSAARGVTSDVKRFKRFADIGRDLFVGGLNTSHGGNMSESDGTTIWITRRNNMLGRLVPSDIVDVSVDGSFGARDGEASLETVVHRAIYQAIFSSEADVRPWYSIDAELGVYTAAIIHAHPAHAIAHSLKHATLQPKDAEGSLVLGKKVAIVKAAEAIASDEAAHMLAETISKGAQIAIVAGHGPFAVAPTLAEALKLISCLERSAEILALINAT